MNTEPKLDMPGLRVLITAGPTIEDIDPVRFISNRSSGRMGVALAEAAAARGADTVLVHGPLALPCPTAANIDCVAVRSAAEMHAAVMARIAHVQVAIMAAAVADFSPREFAQGKIKKEGRDGAVIELVRTRDILADLGAMQERPYLVGFAAESENTIANAREKLRAKNCDMICANDISADGIGFGSDDNQVTIICRDGQTIELPTMSKGATADSILDHIILGRAVEHR
jgi:phosphopantothenoylcysteine decarboxylase / phosphopantothenate---cysteine ligase